MKKLLVLIGLVIITGLCFGQGTIRPTVINIAGASQDSLTAMVHAKDSSITTGIPRMYVTPTQAYATFLPLLSVYAAIDSFATTGETKEITVTGATVGGAVIVTPMSPEYSTAADTGNQYSGYVKAGGGTIVVTRTKMHADSDVKSGAHFNYIYIKPR